MHLAWHRHSYGFPEEIVASWHDCTMKRSGPKLISIVFSFYSSSEGSYVDLFFSCVPGWWVTNGWLFLPFWNFLSERNLTEFNKKVRLRFYSSLTVLYKTVIVYTSCSFGRSFSFSPGAKFAAGGEEDCAVEPECAALCSARGASSSALATCSVDFTWKW